ncbi:hypothetical protein IE53DRAFT_135061 [Violaceomyces palustris]|uniref:Uncharacterized protein n=1 Tax=Violaceomyces palustris TaxID=1673888 RepID=A0ACD0NUX5_9BASI|nr:hypothetical protein IE53DRAFT_135061 [Violaceomyces palustris]
MGEGRKEKKRNDISLEPGTSGATREKRRGNSGWTESSRASSKRWASENSKIDQNGREGERKGFARVKGMQGEREREKAHNGFGRCSPGKGEGKKTREEPTREMEPDPRQARFRRAPLLAPSAPSRCRMQSSSFSSSLLVGISASACAWMWMALGVVDQDERAVTGDGEYIHFQKTDRGGAGRLNEGEEEEEEEKEEEEKDPHISGRLPRPTPSPDRRRLGDLADPILRRATPPSLRRGVCLAGDDRFRGLVVLDLLWTTTPLFGRRCRSLDL